MLSRYAGPILIAKSALPNGLTYSVPFDSFKLLVGNGEFSCCTLGHSIHGQSIPCDKIKIKSVLCTMVAAKLEYFLEKGQMQAYQTYRAWRETLLAGLPRSEGDLAAAGGIDPDSLEGFLRAYHYELDDNNVEASAKKALIAGRESGWTVLRYM